MSHAEPTRLARGFYVLSSALMAAVLTSVLLQFVLSAFEKASTAESSIVVFFSLNLLGHNIQNYLWANLLGVSVIVAFRFLDGGVPDRPTDFAILICVVLAGVFNAKAMAFVRRFGRPFQG